MNVGADTKHHLPRVRFLGLLADLGAGLDTVVNSIAKGCQKSFNVICVKTDAVADAGYPSGENPFLSSSS